MSAGRIIFALVFLALIGVPVALAPREDRAATTSGQRLVIFTPHNEQIRQEFATAFARWHEKNFGERVEISWRQPGGTSEIRKMLESALIADLKRNDGVIGGNGDLLFGGGSYEFTQLAKPPSELPKGARSSTVLEPLELDQALLDATYGPRVDGKPPAIGDVPLYDANRMWYSAALSGFGIVYNNEVLAELGIKTPARWSDLCDPRLRQWIVLVNPSQSGSVTTAFEAILQRRGWQEGWRILRRMAANARSFAASAPRAPTDVSLGDAAAGVCIDFYGRFQAQAMKDASASSTPRVGYVDPVGETVIDPDPIAVLRGAPHRELAKRFIEFVLSEEGQALWQFRAKSVDDVLGPETYELRRMPVRHALYEQMDHFVDKVDPWTIATRVEHPNANFRAFLPSIFVAMAIDNRAAMRSAWDAIVEHPAYPSGSGIVTAADVTDPELRSMLERFDSLPIIDGPDGTRYDLDDVASLAAVGAGWLKSDWKSAGLWPTDAKPAEFLRTRMTEYFRAQFRAIVEHAPEATP